MRTVRADADVVSRCLRSAQRQIADVLAVEAQQDEGKERDQSVSGTAAP